MHEYPITEHMVNMAATQCKKVGGQKVHKIILVVGEYSGFVPESIHMYFDLIAEGTVCEGAALEIKRIRPQLKCPQCEELFVRTPGTFACPKCGTDGAPTDIGKEFYIESIEVEE